MSGAGGSRKPRLSKRKQLARLTLSNSGKERKKDKRGLLRESSLEDTSRFVLLSDDSPMYLPPLTTALLTMYCESAQVSNKMMDSYLEQHVQAPLRQRAPTVVVGRDSVVDGSDGSSLPPTPSSLPSLAASASAATAARLGIFLAFRRGHAVGELLVRGAAV